METLRSLMRKSTRRLHLPDSLDERDHNRTRGVLCRQGVDRKSYEAEERLLRGWRGGMSRNVSGSQSGPQSWSRLALLMGRFSGLWSVEWEFWKEGGFAAGCECRSLDEDIGGRLLRVRLGSEHWALLFSFKYNKTVTVILFSYCTISSLVLTSDQPCVNYYNFENLKETQWWSGWT